MSVILNRLCFKAGLDTKESAIIIWLFTDSFTAEEIGDELGCDRSTVYRIRNKALDKLAKWAEDSETDAETLRLYVGGAK